MRSPKAAEVALVRYYNRDSAQKTDKKEFGPLWEALSMAKAGFNVQTNPFLQVLQHTPRELARFSCGAGYLVFIDRSIVGCVSYHRCMLDVYSAATV